MDVGKWLCETDQYTALQQPNANAFPVFLRGQERKAVDGRYNSRKRPRQSAKSSLILDTVETTGRKNRRRKPRRSPSISTRAPASRESSSSIASILSASSSSSVSTPSAKSPQPATSGSIIRKSYERKARHKTRRDKYEPQDRRTRKTADRSSKPRTKPHKKNRKKRTDAFHDLVHTFRAKNVANNRLTLVPEIKAGLYRQGRASMAERGKGLPDLVFSEMKFLQKPDEDHGENPDNQTPKKELRKKKRSDKDRKRMEEEGISAYFGAVKLPCKQTAIAEVPERTGENHRSNMSAVTSRPEISVKGAAIDLEKTNLPGRPFLGFGSRGERPRSTSGLTWSESITPDSPDDRGISHRASSMTSSVKQRHGSGGSIGPPALASNSEIRPNERGEATISAVKDLNTRPPTIDLHRQLDVTLPQRCNANSGPDASTAIEAPKAPSRQRAKPLNRAEQHCQVDISAHKETVQEAGPGVLHQLVSGLPLVADAEDLGKVDETSTQPNASSSPSPLAKLLKDCEMVLNNREPHSGTEKAQLGEAPLREISVYESVLNSPRLQYCLHDDDVTLPCVHAPGLDIQSQSHGDVGLQYIKGHENSIDAADRMQPHSERHLEAVDRTQAPHRAYHVEYEYMGPYMAEVPDYEEFGLQVELDQGSLKSSNNRHEEAIVPRTSRAADDDLFANFWRPNRLY